MIYLQGMQGLGDSAYQRLVVEALCRAEDVYLGTPWPELYRDLPVRFVRQATPLRTQGRNIAAQAADLWSVVPEGAERRRVHYAGCWDHGLSMLEAMQRSAGVRTLPLSLPLRLPSPKAENRWSQIGRVAVVRPVTLRAEWPDASRNPDPAYVYAAAEALMDAGFHVVSVADIVGSAEVAVGPLPPAHEHLISGEMATADLIDLLWAAEAAVGGVGWLLPFSIGTATPHLCILGGHGRANCPEALVDKRLRDPDVVTWARPDHFCRCDDRRHDCDKRIFGFSEILDRWLERLTCGT